MSGETIKINGAEYICSGSRLESQAGIGAARGASELISGTLSATAKATGLEMAAAIRITPKKNDAQITKEKTWKLQK